MKHQLTGTPVTFTGIIASFGFLLGNGGIQYLNKFFLDGKLTSRHLLATACLFLKPVTPKRVTTCDSLGNVHRLSCATGVISVQAALYGRADRVTCSEGRPAHQLLNTHCSQQGTTDFIRRRCDGKKTCELNTDEVRTSDPCYGIYKYLQSNYICLPINVGQVIAVFGADYGRHDRTTCAYRRPESQIANVYCSRATTKVAKSCNGKNSCTITASNSVFGDPCGGTYKYLEVAYTCHYPGTCVRGGLHEVYAHGNH